MTTMPLAARKLSPRPRLEADFLAALGCLVLTFAMLNLGDKPQATAPHSLQSFVRTFPMKDSLNPDGQDARALGKKNSPIGKTENPQALAPGSFAFLNGTSVVQEAYLANKTPEDKREVPVEANTNEQKTENAANEPSKPKGSAVEKAGAEQTLENKQGAADNITERKKENLISELSKSKGGAVEKTSEERAVGNKREIEVNTNEEVAEIVINEPLKPKGSAVEKASEAQTLDNKQGEEVNVTEQKEETETSERSKSNGSADEKKEKALGNKREIEDNTNGHMAGTVTNEPLKPKGSAAEKGSEEQTR